MDVYSRYIDAELSTELCSGKAEAEKAFGEIYTRYSQRTYAYCLRLTGHKEDAQDVFHETFLKFYNYAVEHKVVENIPSLLFKIARNIIINQRRNKKISINIDEFQLKSNDRGYDEKELLQLIAHAIELLDFEFREAFILRIAHGLTYAEISRITGDSEATVRNRAWRAKAKIKKILAPYLEDLSN